MYESPISLCLSELQTQVVKQQEEAIYKAIVDIGVVVDKDELTRALAYDRQQYEKGYADATPKWISVTDRLPERGEDVLVYTITHDVRKAHCYEDRSWFGHDGIWRWVTHWMPLPEPPKGE